MAKIKIYKSVGETYFPDKENSTFYLTTDRGFFRATFKSMDDMVDEYRNVNRIHKPFYLLFYTDWKSNHTKEWNPIIIEDSVEFREGLKKAQWVK